MTTEHDTLRFSIDDLGPVVEVMEEMSAGGHGWINIGPAGVDPPPPVSAWGGISGRGSQMPRLTWTPAGEVGIEHPSGRGALERLAGAGHPLPTGWRRTQDHAMRGLVVLPPPDAPAATVLAWALGATAMLGGIPLADEWTARLFDR